MLVDWNAVSNTLAQNVLDNDRLDELLEDLGCDLKHHRGGNVYRGPCPVHGGSDHNFEVKTGGHTLPVRWRCYSHHCEGPCKKSLLGLVRGVLSFQKNVDVHSQPQRVVPPQDAADYLKRFLGEATVRPGRPRPVEPPPPPQLFAWPREAVRARLRIPSPYFVGLGFSPTVLDSLDVGHSPKLKRTIVPLYDDAGVVCVGFLKRSEEPKCGQCGRCHRPGGDCRYGQAKWSVPAGFPKGGYLYNYAAASRSDSDSVLLVEGASDVFKAMEAGFAAVAPLGADLTDAQAGKLAALGKEVVIAFDNDQAGRKQAVVVFLWLSHRGVRASLWSPPDEYKDMGEMPATEVARWLEGRHTRYEAFGDDPPPF